MSTYVKLLEMLAVASDIDRLWQRCIPEEERVAKGEQVVLFIKQYGRLDYTFSKPNEPSIAWYSFPPFHSPVLKSRKNLIRLYEFFFHAKTIVTTMRYE
jgi:hypothetical protein